MNTQIQAIFTRGLGLQLPWRVPKVKLSTGKRWVDFEVEHTGRRVSSWLACRADHQRIYDRVLCDWRHLAVLQFEACLPAEIAQVQGTCCGRTKQLPVSREGSGFTVLFEELCLSLCGEVPVRQAPNQTRAAPKRLRRRVRHHFLGRRAKIGMSGVRDAGVD